MKKAKDKADVAKLRKEYPNEAIEEPTDDLERSWLHMPWRVQPRPIIRKPARYRNPGHRGHVKNEPV